MASPGWRSGEAMVRALAGLSPTAFALIACLSVIGLTVLGEVALKLAGVPDAQILSILAPSVPLMGILIMSLRTASILEEMGAKADALAVFEQVRTALRPPPGPGGFPFGTAEAFGVSGLLTQEAVQKDLKLTEEQTKALNSFGEKRRDLVWGRRGAAADLEASTAAFDRAAHAILTTDTRIKISERIVALGKDTVRIAGFAKGAAMIGPNILPIREVPWGWMANSTTRIRTETGRT